MGSPPGGRLSALRVVHIVIPGHVHVFVGVDRGTHLPLPSLRLRGINFTFTPRIDPSAKRDCRNCVSLAHRRRTEYLEYHAYDGAVSTRIAVLANGIALLNMA